MAAIPPSEPASYVADPARIDSYARLVIDSLPSPEAAGDMLPGFALAAVRMMWAASDVPVNRVATMHQMAKLFHELVATYHTDLLRGHLAPMAPITGAPGPARKARRAVKAAAKRKGKS